MPVPTLTLAPVEPRIHDLTLNEPIDIEVLNKLISSDLLQSTFHNPTAEWEFRDEREQLLAYKALIKGGSAKVNYKMTLGMSFGRSNPVRALGLFSIRRQIRHTLAKPLFVDIDIENAHPTILYQIMRHYGYECGNLEDYVVNRAKYFEEVMTEYSVDRESAKRLFIRLLFFGSFEAWATENKTTKVATRNIRNFMKEIRELGTIIKDHNKVIAEEVRKNKEKKGKGKKGDDGKAKKPEYNEIGSVVSYYLQEIERQILETIYLYSCAKGLIPDGKAVLCADGLMILREHYDPSLLEEFSALVRERFGLTLKFTQKEMDQDYLSILDDHVLTEETLCLRALGDYDSSISLSDDVDFSVATLSELFFADVEAAKAAEGRDIRELFAFMKSFKHFNHYHAHFYLSDSVQKIYRNEIVAYSDFKSAFEHLFVIAEDDGKSRKIKFTDLYMESRYKRIYSTFQFAPNKKSADDKFNLFRGFRFSSADNTTYDPAVITPFINHIRYICKEDVATPVGGAGSTESATPITDYVLNWFAHIIQKPHIKTKVALVLYSMTEGVGKNIISDIFSILLEGYTAKFRDTSALTDRFNGEMMGKLFVVGDEINARAQEVANELKDIITREQENIEFKGKDKILLNDYKNFYFTTNNENVFKVSNSDRRLMMIECPEEKKDAAYYRALVDFKEDETNMKHLFNFLSSRDISTFAPSAIVATEYKKRIIMANLPPYIKFIKDTYENLSADEWGTSKTKEWRVADLYADAVEFAKKNRLPSTFTQYMLGQQLKKVFGEFQHLNKARQSVYIFPPDKQDEVEEAITTHFVAE
jgi:hypothetical protein